MRISDFVPPIVRQMRRKWKPSRYGFFGNYASWEEAQRDSQGYDSAVILNRVKDSLLKVRDGQAVYERDSVLFDQILHPFPVLAGLLRAATANQNHLSVLDFGGSMGSSYFQCRGFLSERTSLRWNIVEQPAFVACGREHFQTDQLRFYESIDDCLAEHPVDVLLLSSVLPYLEKPMELIRSALAQPFSCIIIDRTPFWPGEEHRIAVQKVPPEIYPATYPCWFFNQEKFLEPFAPTMGLLAEFDGADGTVSLGDADARYKGFIFVRRK